MSGESMTFAHTCQGTIALMAENARLSKALAERDAALAECIDYFEMSSWDFEQKYGKAIHDQSDASRAARLRRALAAAPGAVPILLVGWFG